MEKIAFVSMNLYLKCLMAFLIIAIIFRYILKQKKIEDILIRHRHQLDVLVRELMLQETLENGEVEKIPGRESAK